MMVQATCHPTHGQGQHQLERSARSSGIGNLLKGVSPLLSSVHRSPGCLWSELWTACGELAQDGKLQQVQA